MTAPLARDLTDAAENQAVLDCASALLDEQRSEARIAHLEGPSVAAEAQAAAGSRTALLAAGPAHLSVVFAMYGETGRMATRAQHPHGEDFVRAKVAQLDWLTAGTDVTWSLVAVDDGCPDAPSSAEMMLDIVAAEGYPDTGHRSVTVLRLADLLADGPSLGPAFDALTSPAQSRKGGSVLAGLAHATRQRPDRRHVVAYTDADLSANLAQLGTIVAPVLATDGTRPTVAALGQRYGVPEAVLVMPSGPVTEPQSTGEKPGKLIVLFRHMVRATLIPSLAHVLDTQAGFKAFDADALAAVLPHMSSFDETFDVELLIHLVDAHGPGAIAVRPMVFVEDFAATNFPTGDPGAQHLGMVRQVVGLYERFVAARHPVAGEGAALLALLQELDLPAYSRMISGLEAEDPGDPTLFDRRWPVAHLRELSGL